MKNQYASGIGLEVSFGPLETNPLEVVLIHEINVNTSNFLPADTHLTEESTIEAIKEIQSLSSKQLMTNPKLMDAAFQTESYIALFVLDKYFQKIKLMQ